MESLSKTIDVNVSLREVYNQWTQFEQFPRFMEGVRTVRQLDDKHLHWEAEIAGTVQEWDAEIFEQQPDQRISWRRVNGAQNRGTVSFRSLDDTRTRVTLHLSYEPDGVIEKVGDALGVIATQIEGDLRRFKDFIEKKRASAGWRGRIRGNKVDQPVER